MPFLDFEEIKRSTTFEKVASLLELHVKQHGNQWRGPCPACKQGGDRALVITEGKGFFCFAQKAGGDVIALVAHIRGCSVKDAAQFLAGGNCTSTGTTSTSPRQTVPESATAKEGTKTFAPLTYLEPAHLAVESIGFDTEFATKHGIGYAGKGILRGTVAIPFRDDLGNLLGYIGITEAKLPADFTTNVVRFPKTA